MLRSTPVLAHPTSGVSIAPALEDDIEDIVRIMMSSRRTYIPYAPIAHGEAAVLDWMKGLLAIRGSVSVARRQAAPVGVLVVIREARVNWIDQLYVAPGQTGHGIGSALLSHALRTLGRERPVRLYTFQANTLARTFYERAGFKAIVFSDGAGNEEKCADVLYELGACAQDESCGR